MSDITINISDKSEDQGAAPIASYMTKDGRHITLDALRTSLEIIADDIDVEEAHARAAGDIALAETLNAIFYDVDGLIPVAGQNTGGAV